jgi:galactokinase
LELATALALGFEGSALELALTCQRAEHRATGVPCGVLDQVASAAGVPGCALLIDCSTLQVQPVRLPDAMAVVVVHSGQRRSLGQTGYAQRRAECIDAERWIGPLRGADAAALAGIPDPVLRRRARHVISENQRVRDFVDCMHAGDVSGAGQLLSASHASLRDDYQVSTDVVDQLVERLESLPGVRGARIMGGGFGGAVVALADPGAIDVGWTVAPVGGAHRWEADELSR